MKLVKRGLIFTTISALAFLIIACGDRSTPAEVSTENDAADMTETDTATVSDAAESDQAEEVSVVAESEPSDSVAEPTALPAPTDAPTETVAPTDTPVPLPPTSTPEPTEIPPTPTPEPLTLGIEDEVAILSDAGSTAEEVMTLNEESLFTIVGVSSDENWLEVELDSGERGWLPISDLNFDDDQREDLLASLSLSEEIARYGATLTARVNSNVRQEPALYTPRVGRLAEGETAEILSINADETWYEIIFEDEEGETVNGWIFGEIVTLSEPDMLVGIPKNEVEITFSAPVVQVPVAPAAGESGGGGGAQVAAPPPSGSPDNLYNPVNNPAFAGWGRINLADGQAQRGGCRGMTWTLLQQIDGVVHVGTDARTNPYGGDVTCDATLPLLCYLPDGSAPPSRNDQVDYFSKWAPGRVALTGAVNGYQITSLAAANQLCAGLFGSGYARVAEFHDGNYGNSGWDFWAYGNLPIGTRFWVGIDDQPANPWNSQ